jgi:putative oxidoreductase
MWDRYAEPLVAPLLLRLGLAAIFIYHGQQLVSQAWGTAWGPSEMPVPVQALVAWGELLGGIAMLLGFLTRVAAVGLAIIMLGAIATVHWPHGFSAQHGGWEYNFLVIIVCAALVLRGGGSASADRLLGRRRRTWVDRAMWWRRR